MRVKLVYGCPCSGKTTYVRDRVGQKDVVYDYDTIAAALRLGSDHPTHAGVSGKAALDLRQSIADLMAGRRNVQNFWYVCTWPTDTVMGILEEFSDIEKIFIDETKKTCLERMENDETRTDKDAWREVINGWFAEHAADLNEARKDVKKNLNQKRFWNWTNGANEIKSRTLRIDGEIASESWFDDEITPQLFREELMDGNGDIVLYINSPGGDVIAASQIYTMLMEYTGNVTVRIDGMAASAASVIAMAGTTVEMAPTAMLMIHNPSTIAWGDHNDMQKAMDLLAEVKESIINAYELKTGLSRAKISRLMEEETWMNARKALDLGFIDKIMDGEQAAEAFAFSPFASENALRRKLVAKYGDKKHAEKQTGRNVHDLMDRLNLLKY